MPKITVQQDVDIDEFSDRDIIDTAIEICETQSYFREEVKNKLGLLDECDVSRIEDELEFSMVDKMKYDFFIENMNKIKLEQLESLVR